MSERQRGIERMERAARTESVRRQRDMRRLSAPQGGASWDLELGHLFQWHPPYWCVVQEREGQQLLKKWFRGHHLRQQWLISWMLL